MQLFLENPILLFSCIAILGLCIGSFLNVVIYRLPIMLNNLWREECECLLNIKIPHDATKITLSHPRSHCPSCKEKLSWYENIPLISFIFLLGKCRHCKNNISWQYPVIELTTALLAIIATYHFYASGIFIIVAAIILSLFLLVIAVIDLYTLFIPDVLIYPLIWLGLLSNINTAFCPLANAVIGAVIAYISLWCLAKIFYLITKKHGMGHGDFKLFAAAGAWLGYYALPFIIFIAAFIGSVFGIIFLFFTKKHKDTPIPFGPFLTIAIWLYLIFGNYIVHFASHLIM